MAFRQDLRTRLQTMQGNIAGVKTAFLNIPPVINASSLPCFVNVLGASTYSSLSGQQSITQSDMQVRMLLYLMIFNTLSESENRSDEFIPLVESEFFGKNNLELNNAPLNGVVGFQINSNTGLQSQRYIVNSEESPVYAVVQFDAIVRYRIRNC